jgi:hypothetical protein
MTALLITQQATDAARALLEALKEIAKTEGEQSFYPSVLRLKVKPSDVIEERAPNTAKDDRGYYASQAGGVTVMAKVLPTSSEKVWYGDDDYKGGKGTRLGEVNKKSTAEKVETLVKSWYETNKISGLVVDAIKNLWPTELKPLTGYGVKLDLYTNRVLPGWHQDWDDGCALFVGLMNVTRHTENGEVSIPGTEILNFATEESRKSHGSEWGRLLSEATSLRQALINYKGYDVNSLKTTASQPFGEMRWFNDAVLVHRTPPFHANTLRVLQNIAQPYKLADLNKIFTVSNLEPRFYQAFEFKDDKMVPDGLLRNEGYYKMDERFDPKVNRALLRITVRQLRDSKRKELDSEGKNT